MTSGGEDNWAAVGTDNKKDYIYVGPINSNGWQPGKKADVDYNSPPSFKSSVVLVKNLSFQLLKIGRHCGNHGRIKGVSANSPEDCTLLCE